jgi:murein DD-endopeptidase MepM/ murein hydrolase activator NlpD
MPTPNQKAAPGPFRWQALAGLLAVVLACALWVDAAAAASPSEKLEAVEAKIGKAEEHEGVLTSEIAAMGEKISSLEGEVAQLRNREVAAEADLAAKQAELDHAVAELERARKRLRMLRAHLKQALINLRQRLVAIYMQGSPDIASLILASSDYGDLAATAEYLDAIRDNDEALAERVRSLRDRAQYLVEVRLDAKATIKRARDEIAARVAHLASTRASLESRQGELLGARAARRSSLDSIRGEIHEHEDVAAELRAEIQAQLAEATGGMPLPAGPLPSPSAAGLIWPVEGTLTSPFGYRWGRMHEGIDIAAAEGTPIMAAASGTVILMQSEASSGGYGNYTCIDHGGGLATCYAHQSSFATSEGAQVSQGELIGYVGNTGHSYGAHLHFEVRIEGVATDPLGYL